MITYNEIANHLPPNSLEFIGANQVKLNFSQVTGDEINLDSEALKGITKFLMSLVEYTNSLNQERLKNEQNTIVFASQEIGGTAEKPQYEFRVQVGVDSTSFIENLIDPTAE